MQSGRPIGWGFKGVRTAISTIMQAGRPIGWGFKGVRTAISTIMQAGRPIGWGVKGGSDCNFYNHARQAGP